MSRIGRQPVEIPAGVTVSVAEGNVVTVKGPLGTLTRTFAPTMTIKIEGNVLHVTRANDTKAVAALHGLTRVLSHNMILGVSKGFEKVLVVNGVGYKVVQTNPTTVTFTVGYSHPVDVVAPKGIELKALSATEVSVKGIDKELVGQTAANIKRIKIPDAFHLYGIRYKDEVLVKKEVKKAGK